MAVATGWFCEGGIWKRTVGNNMWAFVRAVTGGYEIATGTNGKPDKWEYYCSNHDGAGGRVCQEYKAKRRATALAKKLIK